MEKHNDNTKLNFLILQGVGYLFIGMANLLWYRYAKGNWKYLTLFIGIIFMLWGIAHFGYVIYLLNNRPVKLFGYNII